MTVKSHNEKTIEWHDGRAIFDKSDWVPGLFVMVYALVIACLWAGHFVAELGRFLLRRLNALKG